MFDYGTFPALTGVLLAEALAAGEAGRLSAYGAWVHTFLTLAKTDAEFNHLLCEVLFLRRNVMMRLPWPRPCMLPRCVCLDVHEDRPPPRAGPVCVSVGVGVPLANTACRSFNA